MSGENNVVSFDDLLPPPFVNINIETDYGRKLTVKTAVLNYDEWEAARRKMPLPKVPKTRPDPADNTKLLPNPDDPAYKDQLRDWNENSLAYQTLCALERAGMKVPGNTPLEKAREFRKIDNAIYIALVNGVLKVHNGQRSKVDDLADSFRVVKTQPIEDAGDGTVADQDPE